MYKKKMSQPNKTENINEIITPIPETKNDTNDSQSQKPVSREFIKGIVDQVKTVMDENNSGAVELAAQSTTQELAGAGADVDAAKPADVDAAPPTAAKPAEEAPTAAAVTPTPEELAAAELTVKDAQTVLDVAPEADKAAAQTVLDAAKAKLDELKANKTGGRRRSTRRRQKKSGKKSRRQSKKGGKKHRKSTSKKGGKSKKRSHRKKH